MDTDEDGFDDDLEVARGSDPTDPTDFLIPLFEQWADSIGLAEYSVEDQGLSADPDRDGLVNLLEYALGGDPLVVDAFQVRPQIDLSSGRLGLVTTFLSLPRIQTCLLCLR